MVRRAATVGGFVLNTQNLPARFLACFRTYTLGRSRSRTVLEAPADAAALYQASAPMIKDVPCQAWTDSDSGSVPGHSPSPAGMSH